MLFPPQRLLVSTLLVSAVFAATAAAQSCPNPGTEQGPIQNYTGAGTTTCPCFIANEEAGAIFSGIPAAAFPIKITKVGIGWGSQNGGDPPAIEDSIQFYLGGVTSTNNLGTSLPAPQLTDGFINEFDAEPYNIVIGSQPFKATLRFFNNVNQPPYPASMVEDSGCTPGKNAVKAIPGGWWDSCSLGVSGDWVFYVKYKSCNGGSGGGLGTAYCFGDGTGNSCPCDPGQAGALGHGCANNLGNGAKLSATGVASVANDSVQLHATDMTNPTSVIFLQGTVQQGGGLGSFNGDGLLCVNGPGGTLIRMGVHAGQPGSSDFGAGVGSDPLISVKGLIPAVGGTRHYQAWYRDTAAFCTSAPTNWSNGLTIVWSP